MPNNNDKSNEDLQALQTWSEEFLNAKIKLDKITGDASLTKYFRIAGTNENYLAVIFAEQDLLQRFVARRELLNDNSIRVPKIYATNFKKAYAIIEDFGNNLYNNVLAQTKNNHLALYQRAWEVLSLIHKIDYHQLDLPSFDEKLFAREFGFFPKYYAKVHCNKALSTDEVNEYNKVCEILKKEFASLTQVASHRDYHSRNIFDLENDVGVIDFADMLVAPIVYDHVSLLHDLYIDFDDEKILDFAIRLWEDARNKNLPVELDFGEYYRSFEYVAVERLVKVLGQFVYLENEARGAGFIKYLPKCEDKLYSIAMRYKELRPLALMIENRGK